MNLSDKIIAIYPQVTINDFANGNIVLQDDGAGAYIKSWKYPNLTQPTAAQLAAITSPALSVVQAAQIQILWAAYQNAIAQNVSYTTKAGLAKTYQADTTSVSNLQSSLLGCQSAQATPPGFFWVASDNTQVPFTFADLQGLAAVIFAQGAVTFARLQAQKTAVNAATTVAAVQAITF